MLFHEQSFAARPVALSCRWSRSTADRPTPGGTTVGDSADQETGLSGTDRQPKLHSKVTGTAGPRATINDYRDR